MSDGRTPGHVLWDAIALRFDGMPDWYGLSPRGQMAAEDAAKDLSKDLSISRVFDEDDDSEDEEEPLDERPLALAWIFKSPP